MAEDKSAKSQGPAAPGSEGPALETIRKLVALMEEHGLVEVEVEQENLAVRLRKGGAEAPVVQAAVPVAPAAPARAAAPPAASLPTINSPMVGTFYVSSSPEADAYVKAGDHVTDESVVCVIEAMKVFNEIRSETSGTIEKILVKNAAPVEFGQPLFVIRPD
ncbi:MAG: acetyl-CoA carboxylase biotin carboxyl carrier protein [Planctomycetota bacterium]|nr:acetyl-CoA carboxylase biotin carboxyl carrier protein [Planctomycetota bacterium]